MQIGTGTEVGPYKYILVFAASVSFSMSCLRAAGDSGVSSTLENIVNQQPPGHMAASVRLQPPS